MTKPYTLSLDGCSVLKGTKLVAHCPLPEVAGEIAEYFNLKTYRTGQAAVRRLNTDLATVLVQNKYFPIMPVSEVAEVITRNGYSPDDFVNAAFNGTEGYVNVSVGYGTYLLFNWYRMGSGKWEIVAYFS